jgi:hypothetical protein
MTSRRKIALVVGVSVLLLAVAEQLNAVSFYYSRCGSATSNSEVVKERQGDLKSSVQIERTFWRWMPFVKMGDTVYRHTYQYPNDSTSVLDRDSITRTHLVVIGLCSTRSYDALADAPFASLHRDYSKK